MAPADDTGPEMRPTPPSMAKEYTRLRHNVETEQWLAEGHRDYAAATTDITAVLDLLRDAVAALRANVDGALHISKLTGKRVCMSCYEAEAECKCSLALARAVLLRAEEAGVEPHD